MDNKTNAGVVEITDDVIGKIAKIAAGEVEGVASINGNLTTEIIGKLSKKTNHNGVSVDKSDEGFVISLAISVYYDYSIKAVAKSVQTKICEAIEDMTGEHCLMVNIEVNGIVAKPVEANDKQSGE
jgi:uncharacterized alkaline shock family protein YloU